MCNHPVYHIRKRLFPCGNIQNHICQFLLCVRKLYAVQRQKNEHGMRADSLISIHKRVILNQPKP